MIETKRLRIYPATQNQMEDFIVTQTNNILKAAYSEMLENSLKHPDKWEWYAIWMIELKDGTHIGELCFKGLDLNGVAEIGYGISEEYQNQGYATDSKRVLKKCGFIYNGIIGEEGPRFTMTRP